MAPNPDLDINPPQLSPSSYPIALFPNYIAQQSETLVMTEKLASLALDSFYVRDLAGRDILAIKGKVFSPLHAEKDVFNPATSTLLFCIKRQPFSIPPKYYVEDPSGRRILDLKSQFSLRAKAHVTFENVAQGGRPESLYLEGDWLNKSTMIKNEATGEVVADIDRQMLNARNIFGGRSTYAVTVAPGVDLALIVAMCVCIDEKEQGTS